MKYQTHRDTVIETEGSFLQGYIRSDFVELFNTFNSPLMGDGYKVDAEWNIKFEDGTVATIYNWKNGKNYLGDAGLELTDMRTWHVGGFSKVALIHVSKILNKLLIEA